MPYNIPRYEFKDVQSPTSEQIVQVADYNLAPSSPLLDITLVGKSKTDYGPIIASTQLHMLEHFAGPTGPSHPIVGQIWYDSSTGKMNYRNGATDDTAVWVPLLSTGSSTAPTDEFYLKDLYVNSISHMGPTEGLTMTQANEDLLVEIEGPVTRGVVEMRGSFRFNDTKTQQEYVLLKSTTLRLDADSLIETRPGDLAEKYRSDKVYPAGTIVKIGGAKEITATTVAYDLDAFGVISETPAFLLNSSKAKDSKYDLPVALTGRVEILIKGTAKKGDRIVSSSEAGIGQAVTNDVATQISPFCVVGRALQDKTTEDVGKVMCAIIPS